jgi:hypothetical protein
MISVGDISRPVIKPISNLAIYTELTGYNYSQSSIDPVAATEIIIAGCVSGARI